MSDETAEPTSDAPAADAPPQDDIDLMSSLASDDNPDSPEGGDVVPSPDAAPGDVVPAEPAADAADDIPGGEAPEEIDPYLLERAQEHGMTFDEASALGQKGLSQTLRVLDRRQSQQAVAEPKTPTPEETQKAEDDKRFAEPHKMEFPEKDENGEPIEYNPHTRKVLDSMNQHYFDDRQRQQAAIGALTERLDAADQRAQEAYTRDFYARYDTEVAALGPDYEQLFGKGSGTELDQNSAAYRNRVKLLDEIGVIDGVRAARGLAPQSMKESASQAVNSLFPVNAKTKAVRTVAKNVKKMGDQLSVPPTTRKTAPKAVSGEELANQHLIEKITEAGGDPGPQEKEEDQFFPKT